MIESTHFDLLYSNSMCKQSSIPTSILMELLLSGGIRYECTQRSFSFVTSAIRFDIVSLMKYLEWMSEWRNYEYARPQDASRKYAPQLDINALVALKLLLDILEEEIKGLSLTHLSWCCQFLRKRQELVMVPAIVEEF